MSRLTTQRLRSAEPRTRPYRLSAGEGLALQILPMGTKAWRFRYRFDGREKMISLGLYPAVPIEAARRLRDDARDRIKRGMPSVVDAENAHSGAALSRELEPGLQLRDLDPSAALDPIRMVIRYAMSFDSSSRVDYIDFPDRLFIIDENLDDALERLRTTCHIASQHQIADPNGLDRALTAAGYHLRPSGEATRLGSDAAGDRPTLTHSFSHLINDRAHENANRSRGALGIHVHGLWNIDFVGQERSLRKAPFEIVPRRQS
jgi:hypothetical protein